MVPLILLFRLAQELLSAVLRPRPRTSHAPSPFRLGDLVRVGADTRRWRVAELYPPHGLGLRALDTDRFVVLNHTQLSRISRVGRGFAR
jgi:hypothetical protein